MLWKDDDLYAPYQVTKCAKVPVVFYTIQNMVENYSFYTKYWLVPSTSFAYFLLTSYDHKICYSKLQKEYA